MHNIAIFVTDYSLLGGVQKVTYYLAELMYKAGMPIKCIISQHDSHDMCYNYSMKVEVLEDGHESHGRLEKILSSYNIKNVIIQIEDLLAMTPLVDFISSCNCRVYPVLHSSPLCYVKKYYSWRDYISTPRFVAQYFKMRFYYRPKHLKCFKSLTDKYGFICVSQHARQELCNILGLSYNTKKVNYIYNPIMQEASLLVGETADKENLIVYAGRLSPEKRPLLMLKMWKAIYQDYPDWLFYILGDGPEKHRMENYIRRKRLERMILKGAVNNVPDYLKKSKIALLFSKYEGLPTSILEAGMNDNALIVTKSDGGGCDIVEDGKNGFVVSSRDMATIIKKVSYLINNDGSEAVKMGKENRTLLVKFSNEKILKDWQLLLRE